MSSLNKIVLVGTVASEPDVKATTTGDQVVNFTLEVQRPARVDGIQSSADQLRVVGWSRLAEAANKYPQGTMVVVEGRIQTRHYDNQEGQRIYVTEVEAKDIRPLTGDQQPSAFSSTEAATQPTPVVEAKLVPTDKSFDFQEIGSQQKPEGDLSLPPEFGDEVAEDIPF